MNLKMHYKFQLTTEWYEQCNAGENHEFFSRNVVTIHLDDTVKTNIKGHRYLSTDFIPLDGGFGASIIPHSGSLKTI